MTVETTNRLATKQCDELEDRIEANERRQPTSGLTPIAPAVFLATQDGMGVMPDFDLFNLTDDLPGHPKDSCVSGQTLERLGYSLPPRSTIP